MRLIDADALKKEIIKAQESLKSNNDKEWERNKKYFKGLAWANRLIDNAPAVETFTKDEYEGAYLRGYVDSAKANEPQKGEWLLRNSGCIQWIRCSVCNKHQHYKDTTNFCPNCGARMGDDNK